VGQDTPKALGPVVQIDEGRIKEQLGELVRGSVEETLNALLEAEADRLCRASRYRKLPRLPDTREDASRIGFNEEPVFEASHACPEARAVLSDYIRRGGLVYNG